MRKFILKSILFTTLLPIVMIVMIIIWGQIAPKFISDNINFLLGSDSFLYQRVREAPNYGKSDILVLGASHAYRGIDPRIFEKEKIKLFNFGSSSQTPIQTKMLLKKKLNYIKPDLVLYEVYPESFCMDGVESSVDFLSNDYITKSTLDMCFEVNDLRTYLTLIYSGFRQIFKLDKDKVIPDNIDNDTYISGGYVEKGYSEFKQPEKTDSITWKINNNQIKAFEKTIKTLELQGILVVLVEAPITQWEKNRITNYNLVNSYLKNLGLMYINYNEQASYPNNLFYDSNHLNQKGVTLFSEDLLEKILDREILFVAN